MPSEQYRHSVLVLSDFDWQLALTHPSDLGLIKVSDSKTIYQKLGVTLWLFLEKVLQNIYLVLLS